MRSQQFSGKPKKRSSILVRRVVGKSMWPVLEPGGVVIAVPKLQYRHEDVVIIRHNGSEKIKRIWTVQGGRYDVRGDNPSKSTDSRQFGLIKKETILGKVIWPRV